MPLTSDKLMNKKGLTVTSPGNKGYPDDIEETSPSTGNETISAYSDSDDGVLPPKHDHRTVVLCFDGTGRTL